MKYYYIMHCTKHGERFFKFDEPRSTEMYKLEGSCLAKTLDEVFVKEQEPRGRRSLSVGDVLIEAGEYGVDSFTMSIMKYHVVQPVGFDELIEDREAGVYKLKE